MIESMPNSENILMNSIIVLTISAAALTRLVPVLPLAALHPMDFDPDDKLTLQQATATTRAETPLR